MPHATVKLHPGVNQLETQVLNEAAVYSCNLIRFAPDPSGLGLVQKLGGWAKFFGTAMNSTVRALWAWANSDGHKLLSIGCQTTTAPTYSTLALIHDASGTKTLFDITPLVRTDNVTVSVTTNTTDNIVTITDTGANATQYDAVFIPAHISVGGIIVFGFYQAIAVDADHFQVALIDDNGNPIIPPSGVSTTGTVATFTTDGTSAIVTVTLANHGYVVGDTYPVLIATSVGGITLENDYVVQSVPTANTFTIIAQNASTSATTVSINSGNARYNFYVGTGPSASGTGYGAGSYGSGGYGTGVTSTGGTGTRIDTDEWTLDNWGDVMLACPTSTTFGSPDGATKQGGPIYYWNHAQNTPTALAIVGPVANAGFFVTMPQRQIMAYGSEATGVQDPLLVRWCDVDDFQQWMPLPTNFAGSFRLTRGSKIVGGMQLGQQGLLLTDVGAWVARWIGAQGGNLLAWGFNEVARGCGLIAQKALGTLNGAAWWMGVAGEDETTAAGGGGGQFFTMDGSGVRPVPCPIWDQVFQNIDTANLHKIRCATNASFGEIAWYYPSVSGGTGEVDSYVKYNTLVGPTNGWDYGSLSRTAWLDQSIFGQPIGAEGTTNFLQQHEISNNADGVAMHPVFQTGFYTMQDGDWLTFVDQFWPDMKWGLSNGTTQNAQVMLTFYVKEYPGDTARTYGPFTLANATKYVTPRFRGRLVALQFESTDIDSFWRLGGCRYRFQPDGRFY